MQRISTFYEAETKLQDLVMVFIKQSFSGKSKAVVAMIADDMNHYENQPEGSMNFHELIQKASIQKRLQRQLYVLISVLSTAVIVLFTTTLDRQRSHRLHLLVLLLP